MNCLEDILRSRVVCGLRPLLVALSMLLYPAVLQAQEMLSISFSEAIPGRGKVYSTRIQDPIRELRVQAGKTVNLQTESGRHYEARAGGWRWTQVQEVPANVNAVSITPQLVGDRVELDVQVFRQEDDGRTSYNTAIAGELGEWLQLLGPEQRRRKGSKVYGASNASSPETYSQGLYIKVEIRGGGG